jgi:lipid-A-disaccharide synthase
MVRIMQRVHRRHPNARFLVACYKDSHKTACQQQAAAETRDLPIHYFVGRTSEIIELAECALMVSGSVSLEMLARLTPAAVLYHVPWATYCLGRTLGKCHYISLPNLMAGHELFPEYPCAGRPDPEIGQISDWLNRWLSRPDCLQRVVEDMRELCNTAAQTGATARTAEFLLSHLEPAVQPRAA